MQQFNRPREFFRSEKYFQGDYDSMMSVLFLPVHRFDIDKDDHLVPNQPRRNRQERIPTIIEDGALYISDVDLVKRGQIVGDKLGYYKIDAEAATDINEPLDFLIAEQILKKREAGLDKSLFV